MTLEDMRARAGIIMGLSRELMALKLTDADSRVRSACPRLVAMATDAALDLEAPPYADIPVADEDTWEIILGALRTDNEKEDE